MEVFGSSGGRGRKEEPGTWWITVIRHTVPLTATLVFPMVLFLWLSWLRLPREGAGPEEKAPAPGAPVHLPFPVTSSTSETPREKDQAMVHACS